MKIVIDIPDELYEFCTHEHMVTERETHEQRRALVDAVKAAIPLPKGHGRLKDADAFIKAECSQCDGNCGICDCDCLNCKSEWRCEFIKDIDSADVIVEADKEVDE